MDRFDERVNRDGLANLKHEYTAPEIRAEGIEAFNAAEMDFPTAPCIQRALHAMVDRASLALPSRRRNTMRALHGG